MGRARLEMKRISDRAQRTITFKKRMVGVCKKVLELNILCGADVGLFVFMDDQMHICSSEPEPQQIVNKFRHFEGEFRLITLAQFEDLQPDRYRAKKVWPTVYKTADPPSASNRERKTVVLRHRGKKTKVSTGVSKGRQSKKTTPATVAGTSGTRRSPRNRQSTYTTPERRKITRSVSLEGLAKRQRTLRDPQASLVLPSPLLPSLEASESQRSSQPSLLNQPRSPIHELQRRAEALISPSARTPGSPGEQLGRGLRRQENPSHSWTSFGRSVSGSEDQNLPLFEGISRYEIAPIGDVTSNLPSGVVSPLQSPALNLGRGSRGRGGIGIISTRARRREPGPSLTNQPQRRVEELSQENKRESGTRASERSVPFHSHDYLDLFLQDPE